MRQRISFEFEETGQSIILKGRGKSDLLNLLGIVAPAHWMIFGAKRDTDV